MIKSAKRAVFAVLKGADVTDEELITAFTGVEALLNSRPLTYQTANPLDQPPLTPNHFLFGQAGGHFAPETVDTTNYSPHRRWRHLQELVRHFWGCWLCQWLPSLTSRKKVVLPTARPEGGRRRSGYLTRYTVRLMAHGTNREDPQRQRRSRLCCFSMRKRHYLHSVDHKVVST